MIRINLLPPEIRQPALPVAKLLLAAGLAAAFFISMVVAYNAYSIWNYQNLLVQARNQRQLLAPVQEHVRQANQIQASVQERNALLAKLTEERLSWYGVFTQVSQATDGSVWLTEIAPVDKETMRVKGMALTYPALGNFYQRMGDSPAFAEPQLVVAEKDSKGQANKFELLVKLKGR